MFTVTLLPAAFLLLGEYSIAMLQLWWHSDGNLQVKKLKKAKVEEDDGWQLCSIDVENQLA